MTKLIKLFLLTTVLCSCASVDSGQRICQRKYEITTWDGEVLTVSYKRCRFYDGEVGCISSRFAPNGFGVDDYVAYSVKGMKSLKDIGAGEDLVLDK